MPGGMRPRALRAQAQGQKVPRMRSLSQEELGEGFSCLGTALQRYSATVRR